MKHTPTLVLAPMEGIVDAVMRELLTSVGGIDWCVTEFIRVTDRQLPKKEFLKYAPEMLTGWKTLSGTPVYVQLLGGKPDWLAVNAQVAAELGAPGIDLNFGCPAPTVNRHDGGAALLKTPSRLYDVVSSVRRVIPADRPVSAKMRLGFDHKNDFLDLARACEDGGASWLAVHARTKTDGYRPPAYWEYIARIREELKIPVIANGEIWCREDFERCALVTGCEYFMMGRGAIARPQLFQEIAQGRELADWDFTFDLVKQLFVKSRDFRNSEEYACSRLKQWLKLLSRNFSEAAQWFELIKRDHDYSVIWGKLEGSYFKSGSNSPLESRAAASL